MALERPFEKEQMVRNAAAERAAGRDYWRDMGRTMLQLLFWVCLGLGLMGSALHTLDAGVGGILWLAGQTLWLSGVMFTLLAAYRRGHRRGDW